MPKQPEILEEKGKKHFRVSLFGSARIKPKDKIYQDVENLAEKIGEKGFDIITGGGPGIMEAANKGHKKGAKGKAESIGLTIKLPWEAKANKHLDLVEHFDRFSERLDTFMTLANVVIVMPGGIGTCLELFYTWQLTQVKHICNIPIIVHGEMWKELMTWVEKYPLKCGLISEKDMRNIHIAKNNEQAMQLILKANALYEKLGDNYCVNWKKYKLTPYGR